MTIENINEILKNIPLAYDVDSHIGTLQSLEICLAKDSYRLPMLWWLPPIYNDVENNSSTSGIRDWSLKCFVFTKRDIDSTEDERNEGLEFADKVMIDIVSYLRNYDGVNEFDFVNYKNTATFRNTNAILEGYQFDVTARSISYGKCC